jgi:hypothetical protein
MNKYHTSLGKSAWVPSMDLMRSMSKLDMLVVLMEKKKLLPKSDSEISRKGGHVFMPRAFLAHVLCLGKNIGVY